jgi:hypothetical protein
MMAHTTDRPESRAHAGSSACGFQWLTSAFDQRAGYVPWANVNPAFDEVRSDPRFKALVARLNLPA